MQKNALKMSMNSNPYRALIMLLKGALAAPYTGQ